MSDKLQNEQRTEQSRTGNYTRPSERAESMENAYFSDIECTVQKLNSLRERGKKSAKQYRIDKRKAHAIAKQLSARSRRLYELLGTQDSTAEWSFNPHDKRVDSTRRDNRNFYTTGMKKSKLNHSPRRSCEWYAMREYRFSEVYQPDRERLDAMQSKRGKN